VAENSKIEWTDHTFNPWIGCTKVSPACDNCYAEAMMDTALWPRNLGRWRGPPEDLRGELATAASLEQAGAGGRQPPVRVLRLPGRRFR
jgi:hypothetical protein